MTDIEPDEEGRRIRSILGSEDEFCSVRDAICLDCGGEILDEALPRHRLRCARCRERRRRSVSRGDLRSRRRR